MLNNEPACLDAIATIATVLNTPQQYSRTHETVGRTNSQLTVFISTEKVPGAAETRAKISA